MNSEACQTLAGPTQTKPLRTPCIQLIQIVYNYTYLLAGLVYIYIYVNFNECYMLKGWLLAVAVMRRECLNLTENDVLKQRPC